MREMSREEALAFLQEGTRTGMLATVRGDGRPHVVPVWFVVDGDHLAFTIGEASVKARNMRRDPRVALVVDLAEPPYAYVLVEGTVTISDDRDELLRIATENGRRYMGEDRADEFGRRNAVEGELAVRLGIDHLVARDDIAG